MIDSDSAGAAVSSLISCYHFKTIMLGRILAASSCLVVSIAVLALMLLVLRRKAWENFPKRLFIACVIFTSGNSLAALAGIDYSHKSLRNSGNDTGSCQELAFVSHYMESLVACSYVMWSFALLFHVIVPLCSPVERQTLRHKLFLLFSKRRRIVAEILLHITVIISPTFLTSWEPFVLARFATYGSNGLWCDYLRHIVQNCSETLYEETDDMFYLSTITHSVLGVMCWVTMFVVVFVFCGLWVKFRKSHIGKRIFKGTLKIILLMVGASVVTLWLNVFLLATLYAKFKQLHNSQFVWIMHATVPITSNAVILMIVAVFLHFPFQKFCKKLSRTESDSNQLHVPYACVNSDGEASNPASVWNHSDIPSITVYCPPNEMSDCQTTTENERLVSQDHKCVSYGISDRSTPHSVPGDNKFSRVKQLCHLLCGNKSN